MLTVLFINIHCMLSLTSTKEGPSNLSAIPGESETVWPSERATDTLTIKVFRLMV